MSIDVAPYLETSSTQSPDARGLSEVAQKLTGSDILKIAGDVKARIASGEDLLNLTVGDFASSEFPIPARLREGVKQALDEGHSNYPPATGVLELRAAIRDFYTRRMGLTYPLDGVIVAGGARPIIASAYMALVNPCDKVVFGLPSWNNRYYCAITGAQPVALPTRPEDNFFVRNDELIGHLRDARLVILNTPQNPTGTVLERAALLDICEAVVEENRRRTRDGQPALYVLFDQIYWLLTFDGVEHHDPVSCMPEMAAYTIFVDGISKGFAATGLRVGWGVGPADVFRKMSALIAHLGAWAPKPEQRASAKLLADDDTVDEYLAGTKREILARLSAISRGMEELAAEGFDVGAIAPQGAIYLSVRLGLKGKRTDSGETLETDEDIRRFLLQEAGIAVIPFSCFGVEGDVGWFRASVGSVSLEDCEGIANRMRRALRKLS